MVSRVMILFVLVMVSCNGTEQRSAPNYFDLRKFFEAEIVRFKKNNTKIDKSVSRNSFSESKKNIAVNWNSEFSLFIESDINKPAWRNSYRITEGRSHIMYVALDSNLRTRSILLKKDVYGGLIHISIMNRTRNNLYNSTENLYYMRDSMYTIIKHQDIALLGNNDYKITGVLKKSLQ